MDGIFFPPPSLSNEERQRAVKKLHSVAGKMFLLRSQLTFNQQEARLWLPAHQVTEVSERGGITGFGFVREAFTATDGQKSGVVSIHS